MSMIRALQSVVMTIVTIRSGKRFVRKTVFNGVTAVLSTLLAGFSGWIVTQGCATFKSQAVLKGIVTAAVNRLAFEAVDILGMVISAVGVILPIIFAISNPFSIIQAAPLALLCLSASYIWRWFNTGLKQATSRGVVGSPIPLLSSHILALALAVAAFVFNTKKDTTGGIASYVSDGLLMGEVFLQFFLMS